MNGLASSIVLQASVWVIPVLFAITLHEAAHGWVAKRLGDDTADRLGRVTFNPIKHVDLFGTIILPALLIFLKAPFIFGYAKPVPVNFARLNNPKRDMIWVAAAGPIANILMACIAAVLLHTTPLFSGLFANWWTETLINGVQLNVMLAVFNMLPLLPLDGGRVLTGLLPRSLAMRFARTERYGMVLLIGLIFVLPLILSQLGVLFNPLAYILLPPVNAVLWVIASIFGLG